MGTIKTLTVFGTRPEAIKLAAVCRVLRERSDCFENRVVVTAQHRDLLDTALADFDLVPDFDLDIMRPNQDLFHTTAAALAGMRDVLLSYKPDYVIVQGDTTTTFVGALAAFYVKARVAHVEAGLRTNQKYAPFPEEVNRRLVSCIADVHFTPTQRSKHNLLREGIPEADILVTGNTGIDSLLWTLEHRRSDLAAIMPPAAAQAVEGRFILVTTHRRESFGEAMRMTLTALRDLCERFPEVHIVFPVHPNPNVRAQVQSVLADIPNVHLIEPLNYVSFCHVMAKAELILTDSGGVQEEAPSVQRPVVVLRETTERPEGLEAGVAVLVGTDRARIVDEVSRLLTDRKYYERMTGIANPYGDGKAAVRIADRIEYDMNHGVAVA